MRLPLISDTDRRKITAYVDLFKALGGGWSETDRRAVITETEAAE